MHQLHNIVTQLVFTFSVVTTECIHIQLLQFHARILQVVAGYTSNAPDFNLSVSSILHNVFTVSISCSHTFYCEPVNTGLQL